MSKQKNIETTGIVTEALGNSIFRVKLINDHVIIAHLSGRIRLNSINVQPGDTVLIEMSIYDMSRGRISRRLSEKQKISE